MHPNLWVYFWKLKTGKAANFLFCTNYSFVRCNQIKAGEIALPFFYVNAANIFRKSLHWKTPSWLWGGSTKKWLYQNKKNRIPGSTARVRLGDHTTESRTRKKYGSFWNLWNSWNTSNSDEEFESSGRWRVLLHPIAYVTKGFLVITECSLLVYYFLPVQFKFRTEWWSLEKPWHCSVKEHTVCYDFSNCWEKGV